MTRTILDMEERLFDVEELAELEFGNDAKGYRLTAGKLRAAIKSRRSLLTEYEHARSMERQELFERIDTLTADLVRRYQLGAPIAGLLDDTNA